MTDIFFKLKFDNGVNEVLSWFGINLMARISHPADLQIYYNYFNYFKLAIELYCLMTC